MYALKRIAAYVIDYALVLTPTLIGVTYATTTIGRRDFPEIRGHLGLATWGISLLAPALLLGTMTGLTGRTPGKLVMFMKVQDFNGDPPGLAQGILREIVNAASLGFFFGMIYALQAVATKRRTFYDDWLDLDVEDLPPQRPDGDPEELPQVHA